MLMPKRYSDIVGLCRMLNGVGFIGLVFLANSPNFSNVKVLLVP